MGRTPRLYDGGVIDPAIFVSDVMPLEQYGTALDMFVAGNSRKILVTP